MRRSNSKLPSFFGMTTAGCLALFTGACGNMASAPSDERLSALEEIQLSRVDVNRYPATKLVCDPIGAPSPDPRSNAGIKAELYYLNATQSKPERVGEVIASGKKSDRDIFFSQLYAPTRMFDEGFMNDSGEPVKNDDGQRLIEYFALRFKSVLRLAPEQAPGEYEFAVLSDDGSVFRVRDGEGAWRTVVDNDGTHPSRLACSSRTLRFDRESEHMMELDYHQGPRYHISLIVLMRKVDGARKAEEACGVEGNETWFDPKNQSSPREAYQNLLARGWRPLGKDNYAIANDAIFNPCKEGQMPKITFFRASEPTSGGFIVNWTTDIPATSQVIATEIATGQQTITTADNVLRTSHRVVVTGLKPNTEYALQALSISDSYGKGMTTAIREFTNP